MARPDNPDGYRGRDLEGNRLLDAMSDDEHARWLPQLERVELKFGQVLFDSGVARTHAYFPATAVVSLQCIMLNGSASEIAIVGCEGLVGLSLFLGGRSNKSRAVAVIAGTAYRVDAAYIAAASEQNFESLRLMLRFTAALLSQVTQTSACVRYHKLEQQLCRWLLLALDRGSSEDFELTQEFIAGLLGVRRESISEIAHQLQAASLISYRRGHIFVIDRAGLENASCECYQVISNAYRQLLVPPHRSAG
jgi:CRP-like cAMP-binding protein